MTMEEHCPHGNRNAVFCAECEREDRAYSQRRHEREMKKRDKLAELKELAKGLAAHHVRSILKAHLPGADFTGSSKNSMLEEVAHAWVFGHAMGSELKDKKELVRKLKEGPRETTAEKQARKTRKELQRRAKSLVMYIEEHVPERTAEALKSIKSKDLPEEVLAIAYETLKKKEADLQRQVEANKRWLRFTQQTRKALERVPGVRKGR